MVDRDSFVTLLGLVRSRHRMRAAAPHPQWTGPAGLSQQEPEAFFFSGGESNVSREGEIWRKIWRGRTRAVSDGRTTRARAKQERSATHDRLHTCR